MKTVKLFVILVTPVEFLDTQVEISLDIPDPAKLTAE